MDFSDTYKKFVRDETVRKIGSPLLLLLLVCLFIFHPSIGNITIFRVDSLKYKSKLRTKGVCQKHPEGGV